jgi:hypothetical protein
MPKTSPALSTSTAQVEKLSFQRRWIRPLIALALLVAATAFFFAAGATSQRPNGANTGSGAGAVSNILFGGCVVCVLGLIVLGVATLIHNRRVRRRARQIA